MYCLRRSWFGLITLALLGVSQYGCSNNAPVEAPQKKAIEVEVSSAKRDTITDFEIFTGRCEAVDSVDVRARVTGYLKDAYFTEGENVGKGAELFLIDQSSYKAELHRSQAALSQSVVRKDRLAKDYERETRLMRTKSSSQKDFDQVAGDLAEADAAIQVARANLELAQVNFAYTRVTAPLGGRISRRFVDPGNLVKADDTVLARIVSLDPIYVYFDVDERTLLKIRRAIGEGRIKASKGQVNLDVTLALSDEKEFDEDEKGTKRKPRYGTINYVDSNVDSQTGTLRERAVFNNSDLLLAPGMFVRIRLPIGEARQATLIPEKSLATDQGRKFVYVLGKKDGKEIVEYRPVTTGSLHGAWRVVESGINPEDRVVVSGLQRIRPGVEVAAKASKVE